MIKRNFRTYIQFFKERSKHNHILNIICLRKRNCILEDNILKNIILYQLPKRFFLFIISLHYKTLI